MPERTGHMIKTQGDNMKKNIRSKRIIESVKTYGNMIFKKNGVVIYKTKDNDAEKKLVYLGDWDDCCRDMIDTTSKKELKEKMNASDNWREDPEVLRLIVTDDGELNWLYRSENCGLIDLDDNIIVVPSIYANDDWDYTREGYITTKKTLIEKIQSHKKLTFDLDDLDM